MFKIKYALSEILFSPRFFISFVLNLSLGLTGLMVLESFKNTFNNHLYKSSKNLLGADLSVGGRRPLSEEKILKIKKQVGATESLSLVDMFSMAQTKETNRLVYLNEYHQKFPYYGYLKLQNQKLTKNNALSSGEVWVYPELLYQLGVSVGDKIEIASKTYKISNVVTEDTSQNFQMGSIAPKIFISSYDLKNSSLIQKGSTAYYTTYFKTPHPIPSDLEQKIVDLVDDTSLVVTLPKNASQQIGRIINYLTDFLGLVSLSALFLSFIGIFYIYRSYVLSKRKEIGILKSLGMKQRDIFLIHSLILLVLSIMAVLVSVLIASILMPLIEKAIHWALPFSLEMKLTGFSVLISFFVGFLGVFLLSTPLLKNLLKEPVDYLFKDIDGSHSDKLTLKVVHYLPLFLFMFILCVWGSHSLRVGGSFFLILTALLLSLYFLVNFFILQFGSWFRFKNLELSLTLKYLTRYRLSTTSIFLALFFGSLLLNFLPAIESSLQKELGGESEHKKPSLFLFDIQDEQVSSLKDFVHRKNKKLLSLSPLIRSRLIKKNGEKLFVSHKKTFTREEEQERRFQNRGVNLSYRESLSEEEEIIEGEPIHNTLKQPAEISLEYRYAKRINAQIGDTLSFDVMGVEVAGVVKNLRRVRWTSFRPNFFISFSKPALEGAPKTFLAAISKMEIQEKSSFLRSLYQKFPNISAVDLDRLIEKMSQILFQMALALKLMASAVLIVGFMVLFSLMNHQLKLRQKDLFLLTLVGFNSQSLRKMIVSEFSLIAFSSSTLGAFMGILMGYFFSQFLFEGVWDPQWGFLFVSVLGVTGLSIMMSFWSSLKRPSHFF